VHAAAHRGADTSRGGWFGTRRGSQGLDEVLVISRTDAPGSRGSPGLPPGLGDWTGTLSKNSAPRRPRPKIGKRRRKELKEPPGCCRRLVPTRMIAETPSLGRSMREEDRVYSETPSPMGMSFRSETNTLGSVHAAGRSRTDVIVGLLQDTYDRHRCRRVHALYNGEASRSPALPKLKLMPEVHNMVPLRGGGGGASRCFYSGPPGTYSPIPSSPVAS